MVGREVLILDRQWMVSFCIRRTADCTSVAQPPPCDGLLLCIFNPLSDLLSVRSIVKIKKMATTCLLQTLFDKIRFSNVFLKNIDLVTNQLLKSYFQLNY